MHARTRTRTHVQVEENEVGQVVQLADVLDVVVLCVCVCVCVCVRVRVRVRVCVGVCVFGRIDLMEGLELAVRVRAETIIGAARAASRPS